MQLRFVVAASVLHGALIVGVGLGVHSWEHQPPIRPEVRILPPSMEMPVPEETERAEEQVEPEEPLADREIIEEPAEAEPVAPAPVPDPESDRPEPEVITEPVYSSPARVTADPDLLLRIRKAAPRPETTETPAPSEAAAETDAVAIDEFNKPPQYPKEALLRGIEGTVVLLVTVGADGKVVEIELVQSAGLSRWHQLLDRAAINAIGRWRYRPATRGGRPVVKSIRQPVIFRYPF